MKRLAQPGSHPTDLYAFALLLVVLAACAGTGDDGPPDIAIRDDGFTLDVITKPVYMQTCPRPWVWETRGVEGWTRLDDPPATAGDAGYYVQRSASGDAAASYGSATYVPAVRVDSCGCYEVIEGRLLGHAPDTYVLTGTQLAPDAGVDDLPLPTFTSHPSEGPLRLVVRYFKDGQCQFALENIFDLPATR